MCGSGKNLTGRTFIRRKYAFPMLPFVDGRSELQTWTMAVDGLLPFDDAAVYEQCLEVAVGWGWMEVCVAQGLS